MKWLLSILLVLAAGSAAAADSKPLNNPYQRTVLITGSTDGLGREVARSLVAGGDRVILHGRSTERGQALAAELNAVKPGSARFYAADFASLAAVRGLAAAIKNDYQRLDVLINNAGIVLANQPARQLSEEGYELHFQVNYLAGFVLSELLLPLLEKGQSARIINVASLSAAPLEFDNLMLEQGYSPERAYGQSKLAQVMYTMDLCEELLPRNIAVYSLHPATYMDTSMILSLGLTPRSSVLDGRDAVLQLVNSDKVVNGGFYNGLELAEPNEQAYDEAVRDQLWKVSKQLTGGAGS